MKTYQRWCVERCLIDRSPAQLVRPPSREIPRDRVLTTRELRRAWWAALEIGYPYGDIVRLLLLIAQRREEVAGMRWEELDLEAGEWTIAASRNKNARLHVVPISSTVVSILRRIELVGPLCFPPTRI